MEILAIIPARGGSKGIPHKNIVDLCGKPLIQYAIDAAKESKLITRTVVSTDDIEIANVARALDAEVLMRPEELSTDSVPMKDVINHILDTLAKDGYSPEMFVLLQPTSPLRTANHIDEALSKMIDDDKADAVVSVIPLPHQYSPLKIMCSNDSGYLDFYSKDGEKYTTRQELPTFYARNGAAIYAITTSSYRDTGSLYGTHCIPYIMNQFNSVDIDDIFDLTIAECLIRKAGIK